MTEEPKDARAAQRPARRPDASMTLITTMMQRPLDPGYAAAADRREAAGLPRATSRRTPLLLLATLGIGLVLGVAATTLTAPNGPRAQARTDLIAQIEKRRTEVNALSGQAQQLQAKVTALEGTELANPGEAGTSRELAEVVGALPMEGPGLTVTLDDAPDADTDTSDTASQKRVLAPDLQFVANALWEAGAEAVSINGNRLTSVASIRFAGAALVVHNRPLARPYVVTAIGDPDELPDRFVDGPGGSYISTLHSTYGVRADTVVSKDVSVPAAVGLTTRVARVMDTGAATKGGPGGSSTTGGDG